MVCFKQSKKFLRKILPGLQELKKELYLLQRDNFEPLDQFLAFLNIISPWNDKIGDLRNGVKKLSYDSIKRKLNPLLEYFNGEEIARGGKLNKTNYGKIVKEEDVILGGIHEIARYPMLQFRRWKFEPRTIGHQDNDLDISFNAYDIVCHYQINPIIKKYMSIIKLVTELEQMA